MDRVELLEDEFKGFAVVEDIYDYFAPTIELRKQLNR